MEYADTMPFSPDIEDEWRLFTFSPTETEVVGESK